MNSRILLGVIASIWFLIASFNSIAEQELSELRFAVIDLPPYGCKNLSKQPVCLHNTYIDYLANALDMHVDVFSAPPQRARFSVENGRADFLITINHDEMDQFAEAITVVSEPVFAVIAKSAITQETDLEGKPFALIRGGKYLATINENEGITKVFTSSHAQSIGMLLKGRVDAAVAPKEIIDILIGNAGLTQEQFTYPMSSWTIPARLYCRKGVCSEALKDSIRDITQAIPAKLKESWAQKAKMHAQQHAYILDNQ